MVNSGLDDTVSFETVEGLAERLGVSPKTLRGMARRLKGVDDPMTRFMASAAKIGDANLIEEAERILGVQDTGEIRHGGLSALGISDRRRILRGSHLLAEWSGWGMHLLQDCPEIFIPDRQRYLAAADVAMGKPVRRIFDGHCAGGAVRRFEIIVRSIGDGLYRCIISPTKKGGK